MLTSQTNTDSYLYNHKSIILTFLQICRPSTAVSQLLEAAEVSLFPPKLYSL